MSIKKRVAIWVAAVTAASCAWPTVPIARAQIASCTGIAAPQIVPAGQTSDIVFELTNNDPSNAINWLKIDASGYFTIASTAAAGWTATVGDGRSVVLEGGNLGPAEIIDITITAQASLGNAPQTAWFVSASDSGGSEGARLCDGDFGIGIVSDVVPPVISGIMLSNLSATKATISWQTDVATTSELVYSTSDDSNSLSDTKLAGVHQFTLTDLHADRVYRFVITADDLRGNRVDSAENTFLTPLAPPPPPPPVIVNNITIRTAANVPGVTLKDTPTETVPPEINLAPPPAGPQATPPAYTGTVSDNEAVANVEYSLDGGQNWLPADRVAPAPRGSLTSTALVQFSFTPPHLDDGNYQLVVRATDASRNTAQTDPSTLVIDRLPPQTGGLAVTYGPQIVQPAEDGTLHLVTGADYRLTTSAVGGPTSLVLEAVPAASAEAAQVAGVQPRGTYSLTQQPDSGLWAGYLNFAAGGTYQLLARSVDGAGNHTARVVAAVRVATPGHVMAAGKPAGLAGATITAYVKEPASNTWAVWQSAPYGQANPQITSADGAYSLMLPPGTYYVQAGASHYSTVTSNVFELKNPTAVASLITLQPAHKLSLAGHDWWLPSWDWSSRPLDLGTTTDSTGAAAASRLTGRGVPAFELRTLAGATVHEFTYSGKPTIYSFVNTWSPDSQDQLAVLAAAQASRDVNIAPIFVGQSAGTVAAYLATAGYQLGALADPDAVTAKPFRLGSLPRHVFVDRSGTVKTVTVRVLSSQELLDTLGGL